MLCRDRSVRPCLLPAEVPPLTLGAQTWQVLSDSGPTSSSPTAFPTLPTIAATLVTGTYFVLHACKVQHLLGDGSIVRVHLHGEKPGSRWQQAGHSHS